MGKWEMGYGSTLEQRAKKNGRDIDMQWIKEHEADELLRNIGSSNPSNSLLQDDDIAKWQKSAKSPEKLQKRINDILDKLNNDDITFEDRNEYMFELEEAKNELKKQKEFSDLESLKSNRFGGGNPGYRYNGESNTDSSKVNDGIDLQKRISAIRAELSNGDTTSEETKEESEEQSVTSTLESFKSNRFGGENPDYGYNEESNKDSSKVDYSIDLQKRISAIRAELSNGDTTSEETKEESEEQSVTSTLESLKSNRFGGGNPDYGYNEESHTDSLKVKAEIDNLLKEFNEMSNDTINHSSVSRKGK